MTPLNRYIIDTKGLTSPKDGLIGKYVKYKQNVYRVVDVDGEFVTKDNVHYRLRTDVSFRIYGHRPEDPNTVWDVGYHSMHPIYVLTKAGELLYG